MCVRARGCVRVRPQAFNKLKCFLHHTGVLNTGRVQCLESNATVDLNRRAEKALKL